MLIFIILVGNQFLKQVDVQAIREKNAFRIVINRFNELQIPIVRQFMAKLVSYLLIFSLLTSPIQFHDISLLYTKRDNLCFQAPEFLH